MGTGIVRRKGHIGGEMLLVLAALGLMPLLLAFARIVALPGGSTLPLGEVDGLRALGAWLCRTVTLDWVPPADRPAILTLLLIPSAAVLVTLARLTFGIRVLGLRVILIAIAFRTIGVLPSLLLIGGVVSVILLLRPWFRSIRLPLYARLNVILCLAAATMIGALLLAPWVGSESVWSLAFFPVIVIAMLAESIASTVERDDVVMAVWRTAWTIVLALFLAAAGGPAARLVFAFPELIVTHAVAILMIAELFDHRLLEAWPARLSRFFAGMKPWYTPRPRIAVVHNREAPRVVARLGPQPAEGRRSPSVQRQVDALREQGFDVRVFEGDVRLLAELEDFLPPDPRSGAPGGIVLNLATGVQGSGRSGHVPAMLELAGFAYTGPDPVGHARLADRFALLTLLAAAGLRVPAHALVVEPGSPRDVGFPAAARPRCEPDAGRVVVRSRQSVRQAVRRFRAEHAEATVVEEIVAGRKLSVFVLGNGVLECLPVVEHPVERSDARAVAILEPELAALVAGAARSAFRAAGCRDYARVDVRLTTADEAVVTDVKWDVSFAAGDALMLAASASGLTLGTLLRRIVAEAAARTAPLAAATRPAATDPLRALEREVASG